MTKNISTLLRKATPFGLIILGGIMMTSVAQAQSVYTSGNGTMYSIPSGYQQSTAGVYYNASTGGYYNPTTGQYSQSAPTGKASTTVDGSYVIPQGYVSSSYGTYYSSTTGSYYDPATGFTSSSTPLGPAYYVAPTTPVVTTTVTDPTMVPAPTLPNTGAGGLQTTYIAILLGSLFVMTAGSVLLSQRSQKKSLKIINK